VYGRCHIVLLYVHLWISAFVQYTQQFRSVKMQHSACSSVPNCFYGGVGAAKNGVWLTEPIFLIFVRVHIQIAHTPPVPPPPPPCSSVAPAHCVAMRCRSLGDSKILTAFNSKKRFFNEFKDLEDLEY
jgi:hypothetical protein